VSGGLYRDAGVTTLQAKLGGDHAARLDALAQLIELVRQVRAEPAAGARWPGSRTLPLST
jgi:hypothetical protein